MNHLIRCFFRAIFFERNEKFNEQDERSWWSVRLATSYGTQSLEIIMSYPLHLSNPITCIRRYVHVHERACALANPIEWNVYRHPFTRPEVFASFFFFRFLPRQTTGWKHKGFPALQAARVSLNKNERQALINSVVEYIPVRIPMKLQLSAPDEREFANW